MSVSERLASVLRRLADWLDPEPDAPTLGLGTSLHTDIGGLPEMTPIAPSMQDAIGHQGGVVDDDDDGWSRTSGGFYL